MKIFSFFVEQLKYEKQREELNLFILKEQSHFCSVIRWESNSFYKVLVFQNNYFSKYLLIFFIFRESESEGERGRARQTSMCLGCLLHVPCPG